MGLAVDVAIVILYFALIATIGLVMGRREKSLRDFALGGRAIPWWAVMASIIAAETSAATFLGAPTEGFKKQSLAYALLTFGVILGRWGVATWFLKPYYTYKVYTVYDYLEVRFGPVTKNFVSALFLIMRTLASGTRLFIPSIVIVLAWQLLQNGGKHIVVSQSPVQTVTPYLIAIIVLTVLTGIYTTKGGIKAVIWTDVVQAALMFGAALISVGILLNGVGGFTGLVHLVPKMGTLSGYFVSGFDRASVQDWQTAQKMIPKGGVPLPMAPVDYVKLIATTDYTLISALIASTAMNMAAFGTDQDMVQRLLTAETQAKARRSLLTAAFMDIPIASVFTLIGILLVAFYKLQPALQPKAAADVFGSYILNVMPVGIRGIVLAGVMATAMGSLSAALNSLATSATNDFYVPFVAKPKGYGDEQILRAARFFTMLFAVLMIVVAGGFALIKVKHPDIGIIPVVLGVAGYILGPMLGVFLLGLLTRNRGSDLGNCLALVVGLLATSVLGDLPGKVNPAWSLKHGWHFSSASLAFMGLLALLTAGAWFRYSKRRTSCSAVVGLVAISILGVLLLKLNPYWSLDLSWEVSFTWFAFIGAVAVLLVGVWFRTPASALANAERRAQEAADGLDVPMALRGA